MFVVGVREYTCVLLNFFILNGSLFFHHTVELGDFCPEVNSNLFYCLDHYIIVFSLHRARWFDRTTVFSVQCYSRCGSLSFLNFGLKTAYFTLMSAYNRIECFLLRFLTDLFYLSLKILVRSYFGPRPIL